MLRRASTCTLALAALGLIDRAPGQRLDAEAVASWSIGRTEQALRSGAEAEVAWAAWRVREDRIEQLSDAVRVALRRQDAAAHGPALKGELARLSLLDALIALEAQVDSEELLRQDGHHVQVAALVLAAQDPARHVEVLRARFAAATDDLRWRAAGDLLCGIRDAGFAAACLERYPWQLTVELENDRPGPQTPRGTMCGGCIVPTPIPAAFPPLPEYQLGVGDGRLGSVPFERRVGRQLVGPTRGWAVWPKPALRAWLEQLGGEPVAASWPQEQPSTLCHTGPESRLERLLEAHIAERRRRIAAASAAIQAALRATGVWTDGAGREIEPAITVQVVDRRGSLDDPPAWSDRQVSDHLAAEHPRDVAWAGWLVAHRRIRAAVPAVRTALRRLQPDSDLHGQLARLQLLDALVRLDVRLPGDEMLPHAFGMLRKPLLAMAARSPRTCLDYIEARFEACDRHDQEWRCCGELLDALDPAPFLGKVLRQAEWRIDVRVIDEGRARWINEGSPPAPEREQTPLPQGFPPIPRYDFVADLGAAAPEQRIGWRRTADQRDWPRPFADVDGAQTMGDWLRRRGGAATERALQRRAPLFVRWLGDGPMRGRVAAERRRCRRLLDAMVVELERAGALPRCPAPIAPTLTVRVLDARRLPGAPLPSFDPAP